MREKFLRAHASSSHDSAEEAHQQPDAQHHQQQQQQHGHHGESDTVHAKPTPSGAAATAATAASHPSNITQKAVSRSISPLPSSQSRATNQIGHNADS